MSDERDDKQASGHTGGRHSRDLEKVNERLRALITSLKSDKEKRTGEPAHAAPPEPAAAGGEDGRRLASELASARETIERSNAQREELRERLIEIEAENRRISDDLVAAQEQSSHLAQLYAALERIHGSITRPETLAAVQEIVINVVGSEELAVFERKGDTVALAQSFGVDPALLGTVRIGEGAIGSAVATGELYVAGRGHVAAPGEEDITAVVPLRAGRDVVGALVIFRLLGHKPGLDEADQAIFDLLSTHAGVALRLRGERPS
ncbi:MAG TPA: GAF domain-containing protein [Anaeromyxobacteraceae bacterium]|nr:GAF domain-containing protein [Anaeromyxobacteraceae bacterium]